MKEFIFVLSGIALTIFCWGTYGPSLHRGQAHLGNNALKPLICVGIAYFVVAIIVPTVFLSMSGKLSGGWTMRGISWSTFAGALGAFGALGIILALTSRGNPIFVMPLVFGGAPIINVLVSMYFQNISFKDSGARFPFFLAGVIIVVVGASMVIIFRPTPTKAHASPKASAEAKSNVEAAPTQDDPPPPGESPEASPDDATA